MLSAGGALPFSVSELPNLKQMCTSGKCKILAEVKRVPCTKALWQCLKGHREFQFYGHVEVADYFPQKDSI